LYEVYDLAVLTAATLSTTGLSLTATRGEFVVVFHALRSLLTALLAVLAGLLAGLLAATISSLAALLTTASG
jgi:predicted Co/Zn/Cd cation transporter (cation efflux family)